MDTLAVCRLHRGLPGGTLTSLQQFPVMVSNNWPPASHQRANWYTVCVLVRVLVGACLPTSLSSSRMAHGSIGRSAELLWRHSVSSEMLGTAEIVQSVSLFSFPHKVKVADFREGCAISDRGGIALK